MPIPGDDDAFRVSIVARDEAEARVLMCKTEQTLLGRDISKATADSNLVKDLVGARPVEIEAITAGISAFLEELAAEADKLAAEAE